MQIESSSTPMPTIDEVDKVQLQRIRRIVTLFQLTYAALIDKLIQQEKLNRCYGCAIHHPSQNQHSCLMMDKDDAWMYFHDEVVQQIDLNSTLNAVRRGTQREYSSRPLKHSIVEFILVFKR